MLKINKLNGENNKTITLRNYLQGYKDNYWEVFDQQ